MPSIRKLVEHLVNLFMITLVLSIMGEMLNIFFDIKSNENIVILFWVKDALFKTKLTYNCYLVFGLISD